MLWALDLSSSRISTLYLTKNNPLTFLTLRISAINIDEYRTKNPNKLTRMITYLLRDSAETCNKASAAEQKDSSSVCVLRHKIASLLRLFSEILGN